MIQKKICMLGAFAVGKTSLVQRYVNSIYTEKYLTTLGVKIDKKIVSLEDNDIKLMIWDLAGEDEFMTVRMSYLRGSSGLLYIADGTRKDTLDTVITLESRILEEIGSLPRLLLINKSDIESEWQIDSDDIAQLISNGWDIYKTSARNGEYVDEAFKNISQKILEHHHDTAT